MGHRLTDLQLRNTKCFDIKWEGRADCQLCSIRKNDIFAKLDVEEHKDILNSISQFNYPEKSLLYRQGNPAVDVYVIRSGIVKLEEVSTDGSVRIVRLLLPSNAVGIETLLDDRQLYDQNAVVLRGASVCRIPYSVFSLLEQASPDFYQMVMKEWHRQLDAADRVIVDFSTGSVHDRVARLLVYLAEASKTRGCSEIEMLGIEDISALTSISRESISRVLASFKRNRLLEKSGPNRMRYNWDGLTSLVEQNIG